MIENIKAKIKAYCDANGVSDFKFGDEIGLRDNSDGNGIYISSWDLSIPQPTDEQLNSYSVSQTNEEYDNALFQAKENAKASGNQKLLDLGLTQAEATALTGYTPPSED